MNLFVSAGEPSGDLHGANLTRALLARDPNTHVIGFGGPRMAAAGADLLFPLTELAVMGFRRIVRHLPDLLPPRRSWPSTASAPNARTRSC